MIIFNVIVILRLDVIFFTVTAFMRYCTLIGQYFEVWVEPQ